MALLSYALTTVNRAKQFMGVSGSTNDAVIENIVNSLTDYVEKYCRRRFKKTTYTNEEYDGNGTTSLLINNYPIISVTTLDRREGSLSNDSFEEIDSQYYHIKKDEGIIERVDNAFTKGVKNYRITYIAGYDYDNAATFLSDSGAADLEYCIWKMINQAFMNRRQSGDIQSESIGDYSVTYAVTISQDKEVRDILDLYRTPMTI